LTDVLEKAGAAWRAQLAAAPRAVAYLKGRGLSGEIAARFGLGYAPEGWRGLASVFPASTTPAAGGKRPGHRQEYRRRAPKPTAV
jgi:DNA primase